MGYWQSSMYIPIKLSSTYIPILLDRKTADTPSTASQRQLDEACSKQ